MAVKSCPSFQIEPSSAMQLGSDLKVKLVTASCWGHSWVDIQKERMQCCVVHDRGFGSTKLIRARNRDAKRVCVYALDTSDVCMDRCGVS